MATGGKPYYLTGLLPALVGAGAVPVAAWLERGRRRARRALVAVAFVLSAVVGLLTSVPVLPASDAGTVIGMNGDIGETIGWPDLVRTVAAVERRLPDSRRAVVLTANYGEAGAIERYGPALGLPPAYSGHNAYGDWGPPPDGSGPVITVGLPPTLAGERLRGCRFAARIDNRAGVDNDERGALVMICSGPRRSWSREWPALRHLG
jgi:hypothetical protein